MSGEPFGPLGIDELSRRVSTGDLKPSDLVWHPDVDRWISVGDIADRLELGARTAVAPTDLSVLKLLKQDRNIVVRNAVYLSATSLLTLLFLFATAQALTSGGSETFALIMLLFLMALGWWAWMEYRGVQLVSGRLKFPARLPVWPGYFPYWSQSVDLKRIERISFRSRGPQSHFLLLQTANGTTPVLFETAFLRDSIVLVLTVNGVRVAKQ